MMFRSLFAPLLTALLSSSLLLGGFSFSACQAQPALTPKQAQAQAEAAAEQATLKAMQARLDGLWQHWKTHFLREDGLVYSKQNGGVTSEGQSYALLLAVYNNEPELFARIWMATQQALQFRSHPHRRAPFQAGAHSLFFWRYGVDPATGLEAPLTHEVASDGDLVIAYALLKAAEQWNSPGYRYEAEAIVKDLWRHSVRQKNGQLYFTCASHLSPQTSSAMVVNTSYLAPTMFRRFGQVHDLRLPARSELAWHQLANDVYPLLKQCGQFTSYGFPPSWCDVDWQSGELSPQKPPTDSQAGFNIESARLVWHLGEAALNGDKKALDFLKKHRFLSQAYARDGQLVMAYTPTGEAIEDPWHINCQSYGALVLQAAVTGDKALALKVYNEHLDERLKKGYCNNPNEYYTSSVTWLTLYHTLKALQ